MVGINWDVVPFLSFFPSLFLSPFFFVLSCFRACFLAFLLSFLLVFLLAYLLVSARAPFLLSFFLYFFISRIVNVFNICFCSYTQLFQIEFMKYHENHSGQGRAELSSASSLGYGMCSV